MLREHQMNQREGVSGAASPRLDSPRGAEDRLRLRDNTPSSWSHRLPVALLAFIGMAISMYLAFYQWRIIPGVVDPFFRDASGHYPNGSERILNSALSRMLPVPDAFLGALAYAGEIVLDLIGSERRWQTAPWAPLALGLLSLGMALFGILLTLLQATVFGAFCFFCLCSAGISIVVFLLVLPEALAALRNVRAEHSRGMGWLPAIRGGTAGGQKI